MQCEQTGDEGAPPECSCRVTKEAEEQQRVCDMEGNVDQMVRPGLQPEPLAVEHVGNPGQWVPIGGIAASEGPDGPFPGQPAFYVVVSRHIRQVVPVEEIV